MIKICELCKKEYKTYNKKQKNCSMECRVKLTIKKMTRKCKQCKKNFIADKKKRIYCSLKCMNKSQKRGKIIKCKQCGKKQYLKLHIQLKNGNCCSRKCFANFRNKGGYITKTGYRSIRVYGKKKQVLEHHYVWMNANHFWYIPKGYVVHHINGNKLDNRIENLVLLPNGIHTSLHIKLEKGDKHYRNYGWRKKK